MDDRWTREKKGRNKYTVYDIQLYSYDIPGEERGEVGEVCIIGGKRVFTDMTRVVCCWYLLMVCMRNQGGFSPFPRPSPGEGIPGYGTKRKGATNKLGSRHTAVFDKLGLLYPSLVIYNPCQGHG